MPSPTISLYIHIPFCVKKCLYCDFYSVPYDNSLADDFISALVKEWPLIRKEMNLENPVIQTLFFGGGTPSILSIKQWETINRSLIKQLNLADDIEWTIECNPESFSTEKAELWHSMGVTRLTFGIQSLNDDELRILGRPHSSEQALLVISSPALRQFNSIGLDLMYGLPSQTLDSFEKTLNAALSAQIVRHLSAYELTICKNTPFGQAKNLLLPSEEIVCDMARMLFCISRESGFERYEISNFARAGRRCRHNEAYWDHSPYVGLGPAAHSYLHPLRWANAGDIKRYLSMVNNNERPVNFSETIDKDKLVSEMILLRLRTTDGLDENVFRIKTGEEFHSGERIKVLEKLQRDKIITYKKPRWTLTEEGMFFTDAVVKKLA
jgi:oxygen-independent coproporphyrinogen III oxidase